MIDAFQAYKFFMAIKLHLTTDRYDVFESNGRVSGSRSTFEKRNDRFLFEKLGRRFNQPRELIEYFVSNIAYGNKNVIYSSEADDYYHAWTKNKESRTYLFTRDINLIRTHLEKNKLQYKDLFEGSTPELFKLYVGGHIQLETMVIIDDFENYLPKWDALTTLWSDQIRIINKIKKFVKYDKNKLESVYQDFKEEFSEN